MIILCSVSHEAQQRRVARILYKTRAGMVSYSDRELTSLDYLASSRRVLNRGKYWEGGGALPKRGTFFI